MGRDVFAKGQRGFPDRAGEDRGTEERSTVAAACGGPDSTPSFVWGRLLSSPLLRSCPLPYPPVASPLSFPILAPSLSPRGGRSPCLVLKERPLGRVTKRFYLREGAAWRELESYPQEAALLWTPQTRTTGRREKKRKQRAKRGRKKCQIVMTSDLGDI